MAGDNLYIEKMFSGLSEKMQAVIDAMAAQTVALNNINTLTAQGISALNTKASTNLKIDMLNAEINKTTNPASTYIPKFSCKCLCNGTLKIAVTAQTDNMAGATSVYIKIGAAAAISYTFVAINTDKDFIFDNLAVAFGDVVQVGVYGATTTANVKFKANSFKIYYDILDTINDGSVVISAV